MADMTAVLGAGAATLAAALAGVNLFLSGRREQARWVRDALVEGYVAFLDASFQLGSVARRWRDARATHRPDSEIFELEQASTVLHSKQTDTLTRLRLLAAAPVVVAAQVLHVCDHGVTDLASSENLPDDATWAKARQQVLDARNALIDSARRSMSLPTGGSIDGSHQ